jgi:hypothetical protein
VFIQAVSHLTFPLISLLVRLCGGRGSFGYDAIRQSETEINVDFCQNVGFLHKKAVFVVPACHLSFFKLSFRELQMARGDLKFERNK